MPYGIAFPPPPLQMPMSLGGYVISGWTRPTATIPTTVAPPPPPPPTNTSQPWQTGGSGATSGCGTCGVQSGQGTTTTVQGGASSGASGVGGSGSGVAGGGSVTSGQGVGSLPPLGSIGPVSIPQTGTIKLCWPCLVFWLLVLYVATAKRRRS